MPGTWNDRYTMRLRVQLFRENQSIAKFARRIENPRMGDDAEETAEDNGRDRKRLIAVDERLNEAEKLFMPVRVAPVRVDEDVNV